MLGVYGVWVWCGFVYIFDNNRQRRCVMIKYIKTLAFVLIAVMLSSPSSAKVIKVDDADNNNVGSGGGLLSGKVTTCAQLGAGYYSTRPKGNICTKVSKLKSGGVCYSECKCDPAKYPIAGSTLSDKIVGAGDVCKDSEGTKYAGYDCAGDLLTTEQAAEYSKYFNIEATGAKIAPMRKQGESISNVVCYDSSKFTCKSEYKEFVPVDKNEPLRASDDSNVIGGKSSNVTGTIVSNDEPIEYKVADNKKGRRCVIGVKRLTGDAFEVTPANNRCGVVTTKTAKFFDKQYSFFSGCKTEGDCGAVTETCILEANDAIKVYDEATNKFSSKNCKYASGCKTGLDGDVLCDKLRSLSPSNLVPTPRGTSCMSVTCGGGYQVFAKGTDKLIGINSNGKIDKSVEFKAEQIQLTEAYKEFNDLCEGEDCNSMEITAVKSSGTDVDPDLNTNNGANVICTGKACREVLAYAKMNYDVDLEKQAVAGGDDEMEIRKSGTSNLICQGPKCQKLREFGLVKFVANSIDIAQMNLKARASDIRIDKNLLTVESKYIDPTLVTEVDFEEDTGEQPTATRNNNSGAKVTDFTGDIVSRPMFSAEDVAATYTKEMHLTSLDAEGNFGYLICRKPACPENSTYIESREVCQCTKGYLAVNNTCKEGVEYCASRNMEYLGDIGNCSPCAKGLEFDQETKKCTTDSPNLVCKVGDFYNLESNSCGTTPTDYLVIGNTADGLKVAYIAPKSAEIYTYDGFVMGTSSCQLNGGMVPTVAELEYILKKEINGSRVSNIVLKPEAAGVGADIHFAASDGNHCVDESILGASEYSCSYKSQYSLICTQKVTIANRADVIKSSCPVNNSVYDSKTNTCVPCASGNIFDPATKVCTNGKVYCSLSNKRFDASSKQCVACGHQEMLTAAYTCERGFDYCGTQYKMFNETAKRCEQCPAGSVYHDLACVANGQSYCTADGMEYNSEARICEPCASGKMFSHEEKACVRGNDYCADRGKLYDDGKKQCVACPKTGQIIGPNYTCICPSGSVLLGNVCETGGTGSEICASANMIYNDSERACEQCPDGSAYHDLSCVANGQSFCTADGMEYNSEARICEPCASGKMFSPEEKACVRGNDYCADRGKIFDTSKKQCVACPAGQHVGPNYTCVAG